MRKIGAILTAQPCEGLNAAWRDDKELYQTFDVIAMYRNQFCKIVTVRLYRTYNARKRVYANFWLYKRAGVAYRSGQGYAEWSCPGAAVQNALSSAGVTVTVDTGPGPAPYSSGQDKSDIREVLFAVGEAAGYKRPLLMVFNEG